MVFGHRKCFGGYRVLIGSPEGVPGTPGKRYGPYGPRGEMHQPQGAGAPPIWAGLGGEGKRGRERKEWNRIPPSFPLPLFPSPSDKYGRGAALGGGPQVGFGLLRAPPGSLPSPSHLYI